MACHNRYLDRVPCGYNVCLFFDYIFNKVNDKLNVEIVGISNIWFIR